MFAEISSAVVRRPRVPGVDCVSSAVAVTDVFDQARVKPSEFKSVQNADGASVDQKHGYFSSKASLLLLMLAEARQSISSLAAASWVNPLAGH